MLKKIINLFLTSKQQTDKGTISSNQNNHNKDNTMMVARRKYNGQIPSDSPKARLELFEGDHIYNLKIHKFVNIESIGILPQFNNLPVWLDYDKTNDNPSVYNNLFWEIEPMGEYLYYLAGDYKKNEKGLLRFPKYTTNFKVEVNFEDDVIDVAEEESMMSQNSYHYSLDFETIQDLTIGEMQNKVPQSDNSNGLWEKVACTSLEHYLPTNCKGKAEANFIRNNKAKLSINLTYQDFYEAQNEDEYKRHLLVSCNCSNNEQNIKELVNYFIYLVEKYHDMPYLHLAGTTRC